MFVAELSSNTLTLSGSIPSEDARKQVRELSRQLFERPGLDDRLELASGAPKNWDGAVAAALRALCRLNSGKVSLSGLALAIEGVAPDKGTAVAVSYQLRRDLPRLFSTSESISWKEASTSRDDASRLIPRIKAIADKKIICRRASSFRSSLCLTANDATVRSLALFPARFRHRVRLGLDQALAGTVLAAGR